jgi:membrane protease YdiL (CAAX protease family)
MTNIPLPAASASSAEPERLDWKDLALAFGVLVVMVGLLIAVIVGVVQSGLVSLAAVESGAILPALVGYQTLAFTLAALAPLLRHRRAGPGLLGLRRVSLRWLLTAAAIGLLARGVVILALITVTQAGIEIGNPQGELIAASQGELPAFVLLVLTGAVLTALAEELLFRGVLFGWLRTRLAFWPAAVGSALVFGLFHGVNVVLPVAFTIGVVCAVLYERTRSLWPSVVVHLTNNLLVFLAARYLADLG